MSNDTMVTVRGHVGGDVQLRMAGASSVANIRVACTPRRYRRSTDEWVDGTTQWYTVNAWRALGEHCASSLRRGDPVIVHGRLHARTYVNRNNVEVTTFEVEALTVGHDLTQGVSQFTRVPKAQSAPSAEAAEPAETTTAPTREGEEATAAAA
jgi:single-strand DNA-binding protein